MADEVEMTHRVLVLEDEPLIALELQQTLEGAGFEVAGPVRTVAGAIGLAGTGGSLSAAILDIRVDAPIAPLLAELDARGIPVLFVSASDPDELPRTHRQRPFLSKPVSPQHLLAEIHKLIG